MSKFVQFAIHLIVLAVSLLSFEVFYLGHGPNASHTERLIMAFVFCALLYGVVASFIRDLLPPGLTRSHIVQTGVSLTVFGFIILLNIWIGHKIANHLSLFLGNLLRRLARNRILFTRHIPARRHTVFPSLPQAAR